MPHNLENAERRTQNAERRTRPAFCLKQEPHKGQKGEER